VLTDNHTCIYFATTCLLSIWLVPLFVAIAKSSYSFLVTQHFVLFVLNIIHILGINFCLILHSYVILHNVLLLTCSMYYLLFLLRIYGTLNNMKELMNMFCICLLNFGSFIDLSPQFIITMTRIRKSNTCMVVWCI
jgi:hypothetical protein